MIYLSSFLLSQKTVKNPNIYPYNVFRGKEITPFVFAPITVFYGNNGCGKSTLLNLIAEKIQAEGSVSYAYGQNYINRFLAECSYGLGEDDEGRTLALPERRQYIKSEDILYEIKKIQQEEALESGYVYEQVHGRGMSVKEAKRALYAPKGLTNSMEIMKFAQEKYSNGETAMQLLFEDMTPDTLYLFDEPEVSLSPQNQVKLAEEINKYARLLGCQFIIASHSPFMLGTLQARIYNLDTPEMSQTEWTELENVRYFYNFFKARDREFSGNREKRERYL